MRSSLFILFLISVFRLVAQPKVSYLDSKFVGCPKKKATYVVNETDRGDSTYKSIYTLESNARVAEIKFLKASPQTIFQRMFHPSRAISNEGWFIDNKKQGLWKYYMTSGQLRYTKEFDENRETYFRSYHSNGGLKKEVGVKGNEYHGICKYYDLTGKLIASGEYINGIRVREFEQFPDQHKLDSMQALIQQRRKADSTLFAGDVMPQYPGGDAAMMKFIADNLEYPSGAKDNNIEGRVYLKFTVRYDGIVFNTLVINKELLGYGCEREAIEVVESFPMWEPGKQNGVPVSVYFNIPIRFRLY